jgi:hypothetical protein
MRRYVSLSLRALRQTLRRGGVRVPAEGTLRGTGLAAIPSPCPLRRERVEDGRLSRRRERVHIAAVYMR